MGTPITAIRNKLGKKPARHDPRTLKLAKYLTSLPLPPATPIDWSLPIVKAGVQWGMDGNDQYGDCFWAMFAHTVMTWTGNVDINNIVIPTTDEVLAAYSAATGFKASDPSTDQGTDMLAGLNFLRTTGMAGHKIGAYMAVNPKDHIEVMSALYLFGALLVGVQFPSDWMDAQIWDVSSAAIEGGHAIPGIIADTTTGPTIVTWGELRQMTWAGFDQNVDELYVTLPQDWLSVAGKAPNGLDIATLTADLALVTA